MRCFKVYFLFAGKYHAQLIAGQGWSNSMSVRGGKGWQALGLLVLLALQVHAHSVHHSTERPLKAYDSCDERKKKCLHHHRGDEMDEKDAIGEYST